jgi:Transcriptional regulators
LELIRQLRNGRRAFKEVAQALDLSETTVRTKVSRLVESGLLDIASLVEPDNLPDGYTTALMGIKLNTTAMLEVSKKISELPWVISVSLVTGQYDLFLLVILPPSVKLLDFFDKLLSLEPGAIRSHETFIVYESVNLKIPFDPDM